MVSLQQTYQFGKHLIPRSCVFLATQLSYAFTNIRPVVPGHVLVSTIRPVKRFADMTSDEVTDLFQCVHRISPLLERTHNGTSLTIALQDGKDAGQSVEHVHVHILPRKPGDFANNDDIYEKLATHDKEEKTRLRSVQEMATEAEQLKKLFPQ